MFTFCLGTFQKLNFSKCNASMFFFFFWFRMEVVLDVWWHTFIQSQSCRFPRLLYRPGCNVTPREATFSHPFLFEKTGYKRSAKMRRIPLDAREHFESKCAFTRAIMFLLKGSGVFFSHRRSWIRQSGGRVHSFPSTHIQYWSDYP